MFQEYPNWLISKMPETVNGNPYYGYKKELRIAKSAYFRSVAFVAKEHLVRLEGESNLNTNLVFKKVPPRSELLRKLLDKYELQYNKLIEAGYC